MENKQIIFNFDDMTGKDAGTQEVKRQFLKAGVKVIEADTSGGIKRVAGISYRELRLIFRDGQTVTMRVKQTGDIYQVMINDRVIPIKNQDDHAKAIDDIAKILDSGRSAFQKKLAVTQAKLPPSIRTAAPRMEVILIERRDSLKDAIASANDKLASLIPEVATA